ncbi:MAG TPA: hypothetical protein VFA43_14505, partial [Gemmatimonadaceae bacterium]|nr:hypothetical protein [Gemmatimonadaceae bacterium]
MAEDLRAALVRLTSGDLTALAIVERAALDAIQEAATDGASLVVRGATVATVIGHLVVDRSQTDAIRRWASLIARDIDADWEPEEPVRAALMRLDALGDVVDGEITDEEAAALTASLRAAR